MTLDDGYKHQPVPVFRTLSSIETMLCLDGERVEGQVRGSRAWKGGVDVQTLEVHFSSVRQAEQRNNEEEHGAKRGVRGLYKLGQRVLTERLLLTLSTPTAFAQPDTRFDAHADPPSAFFQIHSLTMVSRATYSEQGQLLARAQHSWRRDL